MLKCKQKLSKENISHLVYLHGEVVLQHLCFLFQEVHYVLSQAFFGTVLFSPAALLRLQSQHGQVIKRCWGLKTHYPPLGSPQCFLITDVVHFTYRQSEYTEISKVINEYLVEKLLAVRETHYET